MDIVKGKIRKKIRDLRIWFSRLYFRTPNVSSSSYLAIGSSISCDLELGAYGYIGKGASICPKVIMGNYVMIGPNVTITGQDHIYDKVETPIIFSGRPVHPETTIGDDVWIASRVVILAGISIGRGAIVAAGSVVTKNVGDYSIVAGVPAASVGERFSKNEQKRHSEMLDKEPYEGEYCGRVT